jgi:L-threonylcarbamoyladenylate synthase
MILTSYSIMETVTLLRNGGLVVFPTDTVYGLGADARNKTATERVFNVKGRQPGLNLPVLACDLAQAEECAVFTTGALSLVAAFWPGALTLVLERRKGFPGHVCNNGPKIAIRVPDHWLAVSLPRLLGGPITGTSANLSGKPSAIDIEDARAQLAGRVNNYLDAGRTSGGLESTIVDASGDHPVLLREGFIPQSSIRRIWS